MKPFIQITRHLYEEPYHLNLVIIASNGRAMGSLEIYTNPDQLKQIGENLVSFPKHSRSNYLFEIGSERKEDNFARYFRLRAFAKGSLRKCGLHLRFNNNATHNNYQGKPGEIETPTLPQISDFCIDMNPEEIRKLGELIFDFSKCQHDRLYWCPDDSYLDIIVSQPPRYLGCVEEEAFNALPK